nr:MAG TPA: hypothetical protein [Caudoviricetes sp.]
MYKNREDKNPLYFFILTYIKLLTNIFLCITI